MRVLNMDSSSSSPSDDFPSPVSWLLRLACGCGAASTSVFLSAIDVALDDFVKRKRDGSRCFGKVGCSKSLPSARKGDRSCE